jgi:RNA polymerase sigma factor FliA
MYGNDTDETANAERERLILEHLPQVRLIARRIHERLPDHISLDDLVSTGVVGLISAIDRFDPKQGVLLKTYAEYKIRGAILDSLRGLDWAPREKRKRAKQIAAAIDAAERSLHRTPDEEEIARQLNISLDEYQKWLAEVQGLTIENLEYAAGAGGESRSLLMFISDDQQNLPSNLFERAELEALLAEAVRKMPQIERTVLSLYYEQELSLREIGEVMKVHLSRVSQLKAQAILRLRTYMEKRWALPEKKA